ncbi:MAG: hypothetical protein J0H08_02115 [Rhizobiales bacterium]|nr:hypothetical protein [Hyphomicrobiales bacterium]
MSTKESPPAPDLFARLPAIIEIYGRVMSGLLMLLGLFHWAVILGIVAGQGGMFEDMTTPWMMATINLAVVDLVAAVGLWQRVAWGNVLWVYAALFEIAMHTVFIATFGADYLIVAFHLFSVAGYFVLLYVAHRATR